jgi:hypothetical protein
MTKNTGALRDRHRWHDPHLSGLGRNRSRNRDEPQEVEPKSEITLAEPTRARADVRRSGGRILAMTRGNGLPPPPQPRRRPTASLRRRCANWRLKRKLTPSRHLLRRLWHRGRPSPLPGSWPMSDEAALQLANAHLYFPPESSTHCRSLNWVG